MLFDCNSEQSATPVLYTDFLACKECIYVNNYPGALVFVRVDVGGWAGGQGGWVWVSLWFMSDCGPFCVMLLVFVRFLFVHMCVNVYCLFFLMYSRQRGVARGPRFARGLKVVYVWHCELADNFV